MLVMRGEGGVLMSSSGSPSLCLESFFSLKASFPLGAFPLELGAGGICAELPKVDS